MLKLILGFTIVSSTGLVAGAFWSQAPTPIGAVVCLMVGGLWLVNALRLNHRLDPFLGLLSVTGLAIWGVFLGLNGTALTIAVVLAIAAWDVERFVCRLERFERVEVEGELELDYLKRLGVVGTIALGLSLVGIHLELTLSFGAALSTGIVAAVGLLILLRWSATRSRL